MPTAVPEAVARYFELDAGDADSIAVLFTDDAIVVDEGRTHRGTAAIRAWWTGPAAAYSYTTDLLDTEALGPDQFVVTARLTGNFPGGTAVLGHDFTVEGERIARLVIAP